MYVQKSIGILGTFVIGHFCPTRDSFMTETIFSYSYLLFIFGGSVEKKTWVLLKKSMFILMLTILEIWFIFNTELNKGGKNGRTRIGCSKW